MTFWPLLTGRRLLPILVALVGLALVGHICALPAAEWDHVEATESRAPAESDHSDGSHVASCSCDATTAKAAPSCSHATDSLIALLTDGKIVNGGAPPSDQTLSTLLAPRRALDRSLFLLNASFLI